MSEDVSEPVGGVPSPRIRVGSSATSLRGEGTPPTGSEAARLWRQAAWITVGAAAVFLFLRFLPTGTNLNHMDFRATGRNSIDFCDPLNPQFIPVVDVRSPVTMALITGGATVRVGEPVQGTITLKTASGKLIAPEDLLVVHTKKLHLLIVDPALEDYQHVHPVPGKKAGQWNFEFTPRRTGIYRVFADFTPVATARGLYASADLVVTAQGSFVDPTVGRVAAEARAAVGPTAGRTEQRADVVGVVERDGIRFTLSAATLPIRAQRTADLKFSAVRAAGGRVALEPVMGAFAHLVAFDEGRRGFAHLHPMETDLLAPPDAVKPVLSFKITIPNAGRYVIWAQVNVGGRETFLPFWFDVGP